MSTAESNQQQTDLGPIARPATPTADREGPAPSEPAVLVASQWQLMWWKFRRHKLALVGGIVVILL